MRGVDKLSNQLSPFGEGEKGPVTPADFRLGSIGLGIFMMDRRKTFILVDDVTTIKLLLDLWIDLPRSVFLEGGS
jgi:hypothetical protein